MEDKGGVDVGGFREDELHDTETVRGVPLRKVVECGRLTERRDVCLNALESASYSLAAGARGGLRFGGLVNNPCAKKGAEHLLGQSRQTRAEYDRYSSYRVVWWLVREGCGVIDGCITSSSGNVC